MLKIISTAILGLLLASLSLTSVGCQAAAPTPPDEVSPGVLYPEVAGRRVVTRQEIIPPTPAFNFRLTAQSGSRVSLADLRGKVVAITFIYTNCPDACPLLAANYLQIQREFPEALERGDLALVLITTDPERDTPERLRQYTQALGGKWLFLTGSLAEMETVWREYGVYREVRERTKEIIIYHSYITYLLDRQGMNRIKHVGVWYPRDLIPDIGALLEER